MQAMARPEITLKFAFFLKYCGLVSYIKHISNLFNWKKVLFISLNYRSSLHFYLKLKNRIFCLLELAKPDI